LIPIGTHLLLELRNCDENLLDNIKHIESAMVGAALEAGATIVGQSFHKFDPRGVTGIVAIAESHLSIHTWPEYAYAAADIFTCGKDFRPRKAAQLIVDGLRCTEPSITELKRGPHSVPTVAATT
jgi:S-adenosylmethionine decarboxylase